MGQTGWSVKADIRSDTVPTHLTCPAHLAPPTYFTEMVHDTDAFSGG